VTKLGMSNAAPSNNGGAISLAASPSRGAKRTSSGSQIKKPPVEATAWCYTGTKEDTNFSFAWTIENFGRKMEIYKNGECLTSDTFKVEVEGVETAWKLECFPNGKQKIGEDTAGAVSVFLYPANGAAINRQFSFAIGFVNEECSRVMKGKGDHCFKDNQNGWGWLKLVTHQTLRFANGDKLLPNDCLNILCVMKFRGSEVTMSGTSRPTSTFSGAGESNGSQEGLDGEDASNGMLELLQTGELADVDVMVGGRVFRCHKAILGARSPVLKAAFVHNMMEKATGKINIDGIESNTVEDMLKYIYGGKIENLEEKATKLLAAADQYDLKLLKKKCEELLCKSLNISNCLDYLILADMHSTDILKPLVIRFVVENSREVVTQENWKEKLMTFTDVFAEVFNELASQPPRKKSRGDSEDWRLSGASIGGASRGSPGQAGVSRGGQALEAYFRNSLM